MSEIFVPDPRGLLQEIGWIQYQSCMRLCQLVKLYRKLEVELQVVEHLTGEDSIDHPINSN